MVDKRKASDKGSTEAGQGAEGAPAGSGIFGSFNAFGMPWPMPGLPFTQAFNPAGQNPSQTPSTPLGSVPDFGAMTQAFAQMFGGSGMQGLPGLAQIPNMPPLAGVSIDPAGMAELQQEYLRRWQDMLSSAGDTKPPTLKDKRFADQSWQNNGLYSWTAAAYLLNSEFLLRMADLVKGDAKTRDRVRFATQQWVDAASPANFFATNPEAQRMLVESQGKSLVAGIENLVGDIQKGKLSQNDDSVFEVGRNVATSPGSVVFQNELMQIIQYAPTTAKVGSRPILLVPPCINKFYIMDLQPDNSMVGFLVSQGLTVYMLSWRNVNASQGQLGWDDYLQLGVIDAIGVVRDLSGQDKINLLGFCVGGTIVSTALAVLAARGEHPVESLTLLTTLLDFSDPGVLGVFIDEQQVQMREQTLGGGGLLNGRELATTFSFLRPSDLVWNYVVNNYLKGQRPPAFDLLYWNGDSTNLPGPMFAWYLRHLYLQNELREPGKLVCLGEPVDLRKVKVPVYCMAAREDHIVPWTAAYKTTHLLGGDVHFVLSASGHIAGTINPASKNKRSYWTAPNNPKTSEAWLKESTEHPGSWWNDWIAWLKPFMGSQQDAPKQAGDGKTYRAIEAAPGSYVKQAA